jgi:hypothetical protein
MRSVIATGWRMHFAMVVIIPAAPMDPGTVVKPGPVVVFRTIIHAVGFAIHSDASCTAG